MIRVTNTILLVLLAAMFGAAVKDRSLDVVLLFTTLAAIVQSVAISVEEK